MSDKNWPGLGFCPAPGDLPAIAKMYADVDAVARELEELRHALADLGSEGSAWQGEAARNFAGKLGELPKYLTQGHESMAACSRALKTWHTQLTGLLSTGRTMEAQAVELRSRLGDMNVQCDTAERPSTPPRSPPTRPPRRRPRPTSRPNSKPSSSSRTSSTR